MDSNVVDPDGRVLHVQELVMYIMANIGRCRTALHCAVLCYTCCVAFRFVLCSTNSLAAAYIQPDHHKRESHRQLPLGTDDFSTFTAFSLSKSAARSFHENILQDQSCFLVKKLYDQKGELLSADSICFPERVVKNSTGAPADTAQIQCVLQLKGCQIF